jgi:hypothetical protein
MEITNELLAAYAEGNVTPEERKQIRQYLTEHPDQLESVMLMMDSDDFDIQLENQDSASSCSFDEELDALLDEIDSEEPETSAPSISILPLMSKAAQNLVDNLCAVRCEGYALRALDIDVSDEELEKESEENGWLKSEGTPLHCIGLLSEKRGLYVSRRYGCSLDEIIRAVSNEEIVIAAIDNTELGQSLEEATRNDLQNGKNPNHAVIIQSVDFVKKTITIIEPRISTLSQTYPIDIFQNAWDDSVNYIVILSNQSNYEPHPLILDDVTIEPELMELREAIAENAHEVWAKTRKGQGWTYGPERDDEKKLHPDMIPYNLLPESEKEYDRQMAINTIKLVKKLGWDLKKRKDNGRFE